MFAFEAGYSNDKTSLRVYIIMYSIREDKPYLDIPFAMEL